MKKNLVLQVQVEYDNNVRSEKPHIYHGELYRRSKESAIKYASRCDADYMCITDLSAFPNHSATFQRFVMFDMTQYEQVFYVDSDAIIMDICPNIFEMGVVGMGAVPDFNLSEKSHINRNATVMKKLNLKNLRPFCSGVLIMDSDWRMRKKDAAMLWMDKMVRGQHVLNKIQDGEEYYQLSDDWGAWHTRGKYIEHWACADGKLRFEEAYKNNNK